MKKRIAGALVASLLMGSAPGWAEGQNPTTKPTAEESAQRQEFHDSIDRAIEGIVQGKPAPDAPAVVPNEPNASGPQLTTYERRDLDARSAALKTDPVARGAGSIIMILLGTALTIGLTVWAINKSKDDTNTTTTPSMARP